MTTRPFPGITRTPGVCGGDPCIAGSRIMIWLLEGYRRLGMSDISIMGLYPHLGLCDLSPVWEFVEANKEEIERQIRENEEE